MNRFLGHVTDSFRALRGALANPALRRLQLGYGGFVVAEWSTWIAILVYAYQAGGPTATGLVAFIQLAPAALFAPAAATLGDRYRRERVLAWAYLGQALTFAATGAAIVLGLPVGVVYVLAVMANCSLTLGRPLQGSLVPWLARTPAEVTASNVATSTIDGLGLLVGPLLAALLLSTTTPGTVFLVMGAVQAGSALLVSRIRAERPADSIPAAARGGPYRQFIAGFRVLAGDASPRIVVGLIATQSVVWGALDVLIVVVSFSLLRIGQSGVGLLNSAFGVGALMGALGSALLVGARRLTVAFAAGALAWGLGIASLGIVVAPGVAFALIGLTGVGSALCDVSGRTLLQRLIPDEVLARVFGVQEGLEMLTLALGSLLAPVLVAAVGPRWALVVAGVTLPAATLLLAPRLAMVDERAAAPGPLLSILQGVPMFAPLPAPVLERLAFAAQAEDVPAGSVIIRQGDPGDRFYVIREGTVDFTIDGEFAGSLGSGDSFGEIALLRDVPRVATATARTAVPLITLGRDPFLEAVTGHPQSTEAADAVIARYLERGKR